MYGFDTPFGSLSSIAAYTLIQMVCVSWRKQRHGSQITLGNCFQATSKFGAMKVKNLQMQFTNTVCIYISIINYDTRFFLVAINLLFVT